MRIPSAGGGFHALRYTLATARRVGAWRLWRAMNTRNACKTCALGMGGQHGGMRNELGHWPEVCKKSLQAMAADMQGGIAPYFFAKHSVRQLQSMTPRDLETAGRLVSPLMRGADDLHFRPVSWGEALHRVSDKLKDIQPQEGFFYFSGRSSNEAAFLLQLFARVYGSNHVNNCSYYCHQASGVGLTQAIGVGAATVQLADIALCDTFFLIGGNPASNHPRLMTQLMQLRRRGGSVVVINPVRETGLVRFRVPSDPRSLIFGSAIASDYLQIHIGGDIACLMGIAKALLASGAIDEEFIANRTDGWQEAKSLVEAAAWQDLENCAGVGRQDMERIASLYARSKRAIFAWTMGITHHRHGVENVQWITNLALMRGMLGKAGAGLLPIRGHSNVQGLGTIGVTPELRDRAAKRFADLGLKLPGHRGLDTMGCMAAAHAGQMRVGWALGGNLFGANPDAAYTKAAFGKLDQMVYFSTALNTGHVHGLGRETIILPVLARDEERFSTTQESMFSYVRLSDGGPARHDGPRSEIAIISELAQRILPEQALSELDWRCLGDPKAIRQLMARLVPGMEKVVELDRTKQEFAIPGRTLGGDSFPTTSGRAQFFAHKLPSDVGDKDSKYDLKLMTVRSEGQFNTVVYEDEDLYRGQERRDVILMSPEDITRLRLTANSLVSVRSETGLMANILVRPFAIRPGNALMYYPEANVLVPRDLDPQSLTPTFKSVMVRLDPMPEAGLALINQQTPKSQGLAAPSLHSFRRSLLRVWRSVRRPKLKAC